MEQHQKQKKKPNIKIILTGTAVLAVILVVVGVFALIPKRGPAQVITKSTLEKIINVSDLSTFEAIYNGIAKVANEKDPEKIDYYVSYEATIRAGIDFTQVKIEMDDESKTIAVYLPNAQISADGINVDITSLDYIFINKQANSSTVSQQAYKACIQDAAQESSRNGAILTLADENAQNIIEALIQPFVQQLDAGYQLEINPTKEGA